MKVFLRYCFSSCRRVQRAPIQIYYRSVVDLAYKVYDKNQGIGLPVFILHGLLNSKRNWASMSDKISKLCRRMVIAADIRNHGDSPYESTHTYHELAADVSRLITTSGFKEVDVIGHSMGGRTGMTLALTQPKQVHSLIVVDISPVSTPNVLHDFFPKLIDVMKGIDFRGKSSVAEARAFAKECMINSGLVTNPRSLYLILMNIGNRGGNIGWNYNLDTLTEHFMDIAYFPENLKSLQYKGPVLFIGGQDSEYLPSCRRVQHSPIQIYYRSAVDLAHKFYGKNENAGTGIPVVILHGLLGSKRNWASMSDNISKKCRRIVIAADIRNHGDSPHESTHTYHDLAADVSKLITTSGFKEVDVIGHSMGGRTGMTLALTQPMQVHSLVVVDISPISTAGVLNDFFPKLIDVMKGIDFKGQSSVAEARAFAKESMMSSGLFDSPEGIYFILMNIGTRGGNIGWNYNLDALKEHFMDIATFPENLKSSQYKGPVLFIGGERSVYLPKDDITGIQSLFPKAELKYVPGVGHNVHVEDPKAFFNLVNAFLTANR